MHSKNPRKKTLPPGYAPGVYMTIVSNKACELEILSELTLNQSLLEEYAHEYHEEFQEMTTIEVKKMESELQTFYERNQKDAFLNADNFVEQNKRAVSQSLLGKQIGQWDQLKTMNRAIRKDR